MNHSSFFLVLKKVLWSLLYIALFLYTLTFPTPVSWAIFYFFTFILLGSFLSTLILWEKADFDASENPQHELNSQLKLRTKGFLPFLIPYLTIAVGVKETTLTTVVPSLFKYQVTASFSDIRFPRGNHKKLWAHTSGKDLLGFFTHREKKQIPVELEIYPPVISSALLYGTIKKLDAKLDLKSFSAQDAANFRQLREHQQQDALKDIDWKTSFKKQTLMVKDYDKEINPPLKLFFLGYQSAQFEELISLTYSLYLELNRFQTVQLFIVGEFDEDLLLQKGVKKFLSVQPTLQLEAILSIWDDQIPKNDKKVIVAPAEVVSFIEKTHLKTSFFLSEETLTTLDLGGN